MIQNKKICSALVSKKSGEQFDLMNSVKLPLIGLGGSSPVFRDSLFIQNINRCHFTLLVYII